MAIAGAALPRRAQNPAYRLPGRLPGQGRRTAVAAVAADSAFGGVKWL